MKTFYPYPAGRSTLVDAKARLNIHGLWIHFNYPGDSRKNPCRCPWRDDDKPSFSVNPPGTLFNDFATGDAGDAVDFFQRASGLSQKDACRKFIELAGGHFTDTPRAARTPSKPTDAKPKPVFPDFSTGTPADIQHLASLRNIGREGLEFASERGLLWFATLKNFPAWIVTDSARVNAQARRMDGQEWEHIGAKAWTLPGAWAAWPIAVCLHAGLHGEDAGERMLATETAASAIALADWFAGEQLRILDRGRHAARRAKRDEVLELLADNPKGITAREVHRARIVGSAEEARALLARMEADGELIGKDSKPETGGHITRTFTKSRN